MLGHFLLHESFLLCLQSLNLTLQLKLNVSLTTWGANAAYLLLHRWCDLAARPLMSTRGETGKTSGLRAADALASIDGDGLRSRGDGVLSNGRCSLRRLFCAKCKRGRELWSSGRSNNIWLVILIKDWRRVLQCRLPHRLSFGQLLLLLEHLLLLKVEGLLCLRLRLCELLRLLLLLGESLLCQSLETRCDEAASLLGLLLNLLRDLLLCELIGGELSLKDLNGLILGVQLLS